MKKLLFILLLAGCNTVYGQSISINHSVVAFGNVNETIELSAKYKMFGIHYFYNYTPKYTHFDNGATWVNYQATTPAISFSPIDHKYFSLGGIFSKNPFPVKAASRLNFIATIKIPIDKIQITFNHISSGFGILHQPNPGIDSIGISYNF